jgi:signal transduction histidine kinase
VEVSPPHDETDDLVELICALAGLLERGPLQSAGRCSIETSRTRSIESVLAVGLQRLGARRVGWRSSGCIHTLDRRRETTRSGSAVARAHHDLDWSLADQSERGRIVRVRGTALHRSVRSGTRSRVKEWIICRPLLPRGRSGVLWLECATADGATDAAVLALANAVAQLSEVLERLEAARGRARLDALARDAGAWVHDMRHSFQIVGLKTELLAEIPVELRAGPVLEELMSSVRDASALCERALQGGARVSTHDSFDVRTLLFREATAAATISEREQRVRVSIQSGDALIVRTDATAIARVVRNLVLNAIEASPDGETVDVAACPRSGGEFEIVVRDRGRGMSAHDLDRLLRCGQSGGSGTGIGTSSAADCVASLRGRVEYRSRSGIGTSVHVVLPNVVEGNPENRVIVICGDRRRREAIARSFELSGRSVTEAADGAEALERLAQCGSADVALVRGTLGEDLDTVRDAVRGTGRRVALLSIAEGGLERSVHRAIEHFERTEQPTRGVRSHAERLSAVGFQ